jgi:SAM-dependent MidA family methyltransferase
VSIDLNPGIAGLGNQQAIQAIVDDMDGGAISFERFMELALYHPEHGYYRKGRRIGRDGDFITSPHVHPLFGWCIAGWCHWLWQAMDRPASFTIFEPGAGDGLLARTILDWAAGRDDGFAQAIHYVAIEPNNAGADPRVDWASAPETVDCGVVVSNELFDALPVRLFEGSGRGPVEVMVRWTGEGFEEVAGGVATIDGAPETGRFEVNSRAYPTMEAMCGLIERGAVVTFDYGYPREELWAEWRSQGTLLAFYRHTAHENPYVHVGEQDLTAHVDFTELEAALAASGYETWGPISQSEFLYGLGAGALVDSVRNDAGEYFGRRRALEELSDGAGLGRIRALAGTKGLPVATSPPGFEPTP